jgi:hypothetical protein
MKEVKTTKINNFDIDIHPFSAIEGLAIRSKIVNHIKSKADIKSGNAAELGKVAIGILYDLPLPLIKELIAKCGVKRSDDFEGGLLSEDITFNKVFEGNIDAVLELLIEIVDYNGFFTKSLFTNLSEKIPTVKKAMTMAQSYFKGDQELPQEEMGSLKDLMKK